MRWLHSPIFLCFLKLKTNFVVLNRGFQSPLSGGRKGCICVLFRITVTLKTAGCMGCLNF